MIIRDEHSIIVQHSLEDVRYMDGGDSAARMGISAIENRADRLRLSAFISERGLVRHPHQEQWNDPKLTSRDQLVQFCVSDSAASVKCADFYKDKIFINKDFLAPDVRLYLYVSSLRKPSLLLKAFGFLFMWLSLVWNTLVNPGAEMNQFSCVCIKLGSDWRKRFLAWHPDLEGNIKDYWSGWRNQKELAEVLIRALKAS